MTSPLFEVRGLSVDYPIRSAFLKRTIGSIGAVRDVSLTLEPGRTLAIVGESGCGKSSLARAIVGLQPASEGYAAMRGRKLDRASLKHDVPMRSQIQMVFQDPYSSLNPRMTALQLIAEPMLVKGGRRPANRERALTLMERVGLNPDEGERYPHQFSGGQRQRISIARALAADPAIIVLDEPVSALDVSIQAQIINLLEDIQSDMNLGYIFISHDLAVVRQIADEIAVMYLGQVVEAGPCERLFQAPRHPYTAALLSAAPDPYDDPDTFHPIILEGDLPSPADPPSGCFFRTRCWKAEDDCARERPRLVPEADGRGLACFHPVEAPERAAAFVASPAGTATVGGA